MFIFVCVIIVACVFVFVFVFACSPGAFPIKNNPYKKIKNNGLPQIAPDCPKLPQLASNCPEIALNLPQSCPKAVPILPLQCSEPAPKNVPNGMIDPGLAVLQLFFLYALLSEILKGPKPPKLHSLFPHQW